MKAHRAAFTLVELSIVLVIIGLLVGAIIAGQSLLRGAGLRAAVDELTQFANAFEQFDQEFNALAGDMRNATDYWGVAAGSTGNDTNCYNVDKTAEATCNGNGDRVVSITNPATAATDGTEAYLAWQHLANAGYISGRYTGRGANGGNLGTVGGVSTPASRMKGITYFAHSHNGCILPGDAAYFSGCTSDILIWIGGNAPTSSSTSATMTAQEVQEIDRKIDDGQPGFGQFRARKSDACTASATNYALGTSTPNCRGLFYVAPVRAYNS